MFYMMILRCNINMPHCFLPLISFREDFQLCFECYWHLPSFLQLKQPFDRYMILFFMFYESTFINQFYKVHTGIC